MMHATICEELKVPDILPKVIIITVILSSQSFYDSRNDYLSLCLSVPPFVCLSCYQSLYLGNYELDFDETWWKCWNLGPIDCIKI